MKIVTSSLYGLAYLAFVSVSPNVGAAEFTCNAEDYYCLGNAVTSANQTSGPDTIRFIEGAHYTFGGSRCAPPIVGDITIIGAGADTTQIIAQGSCAFFQVNAGSSLTLRDITIASGYLVGARVGFEGVQRGAAIYNQGTLRVERSIFRGNGITESTDPLSGGGAIYNAPHAKAYVVDTEFLYNSVGPENYGGAAILNEGKMTVTRGHFHENYGRGGIITNGVRGISPKARLVLTDSIIENNAQSTGVKNDATLFVERTVIRGGDAVEGGGIYNGGEMTVRESSILRNKAVRGGGVYSAVNAKSTFINTTISQNYARGKVEGNGIGGGIYNYGGTVYLANSTIASNTSQGLGSAIAATSDSDGSAYVYSKNSLIVGHANSTIDQSCYDFGPNDSQKIFLVENNLITEESNCFRSETDIVVPEAITFTKVIGPLADYGGPTPTYALLPGSPAIDNEGKLCTDFDGVPIVIDQRGNLRTGCDKGSVDSTGKTPPLQLKLKLTGTPPGIQPNSSGYVDLAILSRADSTNPFRPVADVDRSSLRLNAIGAVPYKFISQDLNGDNIADLVMRFRISEIGITCDNSTIKLRGSIIKGAQFVSSTTIMTIGCDEY